MEFTHGIFGFQMEFDGVSGHLSFDSEGFRKDYTLDVLELSLDNEPTKVRSIYPYFLHTFFMLDSDIFTSSLNG